jgi:5-methylcytosine-specific restriction endonuclease McrA
MSWTYQEKSIGQLNTWYNDKVRKKLSGFVSAEDFLNWYKETVSSGKCFYCGLTERESQQIVHHGLLTSKRFPLAGKLSQGVNRGYWLEIDRRNPMGNYSRDNCVPCCYFCNNDKSDVFTDEQYKEFIKNRSSFLINLLK